jgi:signal peptidase II
LKKLLRSSFGHWLFIPVSLLVILIDQGTKNFAIANLTTGVSVPVIDGVLFWRLVYNDSAAFSLGFGYTWILAILASMATLATIWFGRKIQSASWALMGGVFLGGVVGNLIDRLTREPGFGNGHVVDFIQVPFNFPVFNLADSAIVVIATLSVIRISRGESLGGLSPKKS